MSSRCDSDCTLVERLNRADADVLGPDTGHTTYVLLGDLPSDTDKGTT
jgi:hypothetical protein